MSYAAVTNELARGTSPEMLCATCPWDRKCLTPPSMSKDEISKLVDDAERQARAAHKDERQVASVILLTSMTFAGRDTAVQACPVFALRYAGPDGRAIADKTRQMMQEWRSGE